MVNANPLSDQLFTSQPASKRYTRIALRHRGGVLCGTMTKAGMREPDVNGRARVFTAPWPGRRVILSMGIKPGPRPCLGVVRLGLSVKDGWVVYGSELMMKKRCAVFEGWLIKRCVVDYGSGKVVCSVEREE